MGTRVSKSSSDHWKFPKIPINNLYKTSRLSPSCAIKDFEQTITLSSVDKFRSFSLIIREILDVFTNNTHNYLHLGLVQVAIKPLARDGLDDAPVTVCLRDVRYRNFDHSLLAAVDGNLSLGAFYFDCFPGYLVVLEDARNYGPLSLSVKTRGIPVALTVRVVCKAMENCIVTKYLKDSVSVMSPRTDYFYATSGTRYTTHWNEVAPDNGSAENPRE